MSAERISWEQAVLWLRSQPEQTELVKACFYDDPLLQAAQRYYASSEWQAVRSLIGPGRGRALDVGSGRGIAAYALAMDGWQTTALEPDPSAIVGAGAIRALAEAAHLDIDVVQQHGESLPFADDSFVLVHCRAVLHHARDLTRMCGEIARVLRAGGVLLATREHVISRREDLSRFLAAHPLHHLYDGENALLLQEYVEAIRSAGLCVERIINPYACDVNLFPDTQAQLRRRLAARMRLPLPNLIPKRALSWLGARSNQPGRHYSFLARKLRHD
jgi:SAM-dependent methyltransferase